MNTIGIPAAFIKQTNRSVFETILTHCLSRVRAYLVESEVISEHYSPQ